MTKYVVTSQPRTAATNNSTEAASSNKYQQDEDNDQCCFVYFYTLYCSGFRCSGCCGADKQKRRPQRRAFDNYNSEPLFVDDTNTLNFLNDELNTYEPYNRHRHARAGGNEQGSNIESHGDFEEYPGCYYEYDNNRSESGGDHFTGMPGGIHVSSDTKEDVDHSIGFAHNRGEEHSMSVCYTDINAGNVGHSGGTGHSGHTENNSRWGDEGHSGSHCGGGDYSGRGDTGGGDSGGGDLGGGDTGGGDVGGGDSGGENTGGGDSGGGDTCGGDTGGGDSGGGDSGGGDTGGGDTGGGDTGGGGTD